MNLERQNFLKTSLALGGLPALNFSSLAAAQLNTGLINNGNVLTAAHWGMLNLTIKDGRIVDSKPYQKVGETINSLQYYTGDMVYKSRIKYPMVRKSYLENPDSPKPELRGKDEWVRVRYEDAIKLVARELKKTRRQKGLEGVFAGDGWKSSGCVHNSSALLHRFMNFSGGYVKSMEDYSTAAAQVILTRVVGSIETYEQQTSWNTIFDNTKVFVIWGADPMLTQRVGYLASDELGIKYFEDLKKRTDIKVVIIDPIKSNTGKFFDGLADWVAPVPGTDVAMMLGMAYHLHATNNYDREFLDNYTVGFDKFLPYLLGQTDGTPKTPEWASEICGISAAKIKELAELMKNNRTFITSGWAMQRSDHGEQSPWMIVTLASMIGQIGLPGGGFSFAHHYGSAGAPTAKGARLGGINRGDVGQFNADGEFIGTSSGIIDAGGRYVQGEGIDGVKTENWAIPTSRIADALRNPGKKFNHNGKELIYPDIDFIYWAGGNPFVHHQDLNRFVKAWQKPRTIVVNEAYWTPTAKMADIVFPTTTSYERNDMTMVGDLTGMHISPMRQAVQRQYESRDDYQIFSDLAKAYAPNLVMAFTDNGKDEIDWIRELYTAAYNKVTSIPDFHHEMKPFDEFWNENKPVTFNSTPESEVWVRFGEFREDPILNALGTPSGLIEIYSEAIAAMNYAECKGHPMWFEPIEWLGMKDKPAEFHLINPHPADRLHSQLNQTSLRDTYAVADREPIWINDKDAARKGIKNGDLVRVFNERGEILAGAIVTADISPSVLRLCEGVWYDPDENGLCKNGCPNVLTKDRPTSELANGPTTHSTLVNIEKFRGEAPELTAFSDPKFA